MVQSLVQWAPRTSLPSRFRSGIEDLMQQLFSWDEGGDEFLFAPPADVVQSDESYEVSLDLPGMKPEEVAIEWKDGQLWISGQRSRAHEEKGKTFHRVERHYGQFRRVLPLGADIDADKIEAKYHDGVLQITVPRTAESRAKRIEVKS